jgi:hypothetical protein
MPFSSLRFGAIEGVSDHVFCYMIDYSRLICIGNLSTLPKAKLPIALAFRSNLYSYYCSALLGKELLSEQCEVAARIGVVSLFCWPVGVALFQEITYT